MLSYVAAINHYKAPVKSKLIVLRNIGRLLHGLISWALNYIIFFYQFFTFDTFLQWNAWLHNFEKLGTEIFGWFMCHFWLYLTTIPKKLRRWEALDIYGDAKCFSIYQNNGIKRHFILKRNNTMKIIFLFLALVFLSFWLPSQNQLIGLDIASYRSQSELANFKWISVALENTNGCYY